MLKPLSAQKPFDTYYSGDPAIFQLDATSTDEERAEYVHKYKLARQSGNWTGLIVDGQTPTRFTFRIIPGDLRRKLYDRLPKDQDGNTTGDSSSEWWTLVFRCAITEIANCGELKVERVRDNDLGAVIATPDVTNALDEITPFIVNELGRYAWERSIVRDPS